MISHSSALWLTFMLNKLINGSQVPINDEAEWRLVFDDHTEFTVRESDLVSTHRLSDEPIFGKNYTVCLLCGLQPVCEYKSDSRLV
jgi:hypothetical protein